MGYVLPPPPPRNLAEHYEWVRIMERRIFWTYMSLGIMAAFGLLLAVVLALSAVLQ